jgi:hypothetical protein
MKHNLAQTRQITHHFPLMVCLVALAVAFPVSPPQRIDAHDDTEPPAVPENLEVPEGHNVFLTGHAIGTQNYMCLPDSSSGSIIWMPIGPQATLFDDEEKQIITHFLSPNLDEKGMPRATWQHSRDTSTVWARQIQSALVTEGAIPWLLLEVVGVEPGLTGGQRLTRTKFIQRLNTSGGIAPSEVCAATGQRAFVPYTADYVFYKATTHK